MHDWSLVKSLPTIERLKDLQVYCTSILDRSVNSAELIMLESHRLTCLVNANSFVAPLVKFSGGRGNETRARERENMPMIGIARR